MENRNVVKNSSTNVIYFTTECNFRCKYCYEHLDDAKPQKLSKDQIRKTIDDILEREKDTQSLFVMFGGEVTLEWENAKYFMDYAMSKKQNVHFNISTNGYRFKSEKFILDYINTNAYKCGKTSLDVSFDGIGNSERVLKNGASTTETMFTVFKNLKKYNVPFRVRYTVHRKNYEVYFEDVLLIANLINPDRIILSFNYSDFNTDELEYIKQTNMKFEDVFQSGELKIPVCEFCCNVCTQCHSRKELKSYYGENGMISMSEHSKNAGEFKDFN